MKLCETVVQREGGLYSLKDDSFFLQDGCTTRKRASFPLLGRICHFEQEKKEEEKKFKPRQKTGVLQATQNILTSHIT